MGFPFTPSDEDELVPEVLSVELTRPCVAETRTCQLRMFDVVEGYSGAPVVDKNGEVVGMLVEEDNQPGRATMVHIGWIRPFASMYYKRDELALQQPSGAISVVDAQAVRSKNGVANYRSSLVASVRAACEGKRDCEVSCDIDSFPSPTDPPAHLRQATPTIVRACLVTYACLDTEGTTRSRSTFAPLGTTIELSCSRRRR